MPLKDQVAQYIHVISEIDKRNIGYILLVRYICTIPHRYPLTAAFMDVFLDGKMRGTNHDVWATYLPLIKHSKKFLNGDISIEEAEKLVADGVGDVIVFGRFMQE